jgi:hypothetical protein
VPAICTLPTGAHRGGARRSGGVVQVVCCRVPVMRAAQGTRLGVTLPPRLLVAARSQAGRQLPACWLCQPRVPQRNKVGMACGRRCAVCLERGRHARSSAARQRNLVRTAVLTDALGAGLSVVHHPHTGTARLGCWSTLVMLRGAAWPSACRSVCGGCAGAGVCSRARLRWRPDGCC